jgi:hypothetical protein
MVDVTRDYASSKKEWSNHPLFTTKLPHPYAPIRLLSLYGLATLVPEKWQKVVLGISVPFDNEVKLNPKHVIVITWNSKLWSKATLKKQLKKQEQIIGGHKPYRHRLFDAIKIIKRALNEANYRQEIHFFE